MSALWRLVVALVNYSLAGRDRLVRALLARAGDGTILEIGRVVRGAVYAAVGCARLHQWLSIYAWRPSVLHQISGPIVGRSYRVIIRLPYRARALT